MGKYPPAVGLTRAMKERGISGPELAAYVGVHRSMVNRLELGDREFTRDWAERFAPHLGKTAEQLLFPHKSRDASGKEKARALTTYDPDSLPGLVQRAAKTLASATTAAEVLEARDEAALAYDASKRAARMAKVKGAHDFIVAKAHRAQADALDIEAQAKRRLVDEYEAAQDRGDVAKRGDPRPSKMEGLPTAADLGISHKEMHEARIIRDAERSDPGIVRRTIDDRLKRGDEPTRASLREAVYSAVGTTRGVAPDKPQGRGLRKLLVLLSAGQELLTAMEVGEIDLEVVNLLDDEEREQLSRISKFMAKLARQ